MSIRRDRFTVTPHSKVCSLHFPEDQILQPKTAGGRRTFKKGTVPVLFQWNDYSMQPQRPSVWDRVERPAPHSPAGEEPMETDTKGEHDYCAVPEPASLDMALNETCNLKEKLETLRRENEELKIQSTFGFQRFAGSDDEI